jgi:lipoyl synthase
MKNYLKKPEWIRSRIPSGVNFKTISHLRHHGNLSTVCEEAKCPNQWECWQKGTATFMIMGDTCTRKCRFCSVKTSRTPPELDPDEPKNLAETLRDLKLKYAVLTSVDRDDLPDLGTGHYLQCVEEIKRINGEILVELLIPDFQGRKDLLEKIAVCKADVVGHNLETTRRLSRTVRDPRASYEQSLLVLSTLHELNPDLILKSSLMLGFGETEEEILEAMRDIKETGTNILTLGQYLQPNRKSIPVEAYIEPEKFEWYRQEGLKMGFEYIASGPLVRSSYMAAEHYLNMKLKTRS